MAISLGGTTLNPNMVWTDRMNYSPVVQDVQVTLGGTPIVYAQSKEGGQPITLTAYADQGWLTKSMVDAVQTYAQQAGLVLALVIGSESFDVMFRHHEPPAVNFQPLIPRAVPLPEDYFVGEIKLMTI